MGVLSFTSRSCCQARNSSFSNGACKHNVSVKKGSFLPDYDNLCCTESFFCPQAGFSKFTTSRFCQMQNTKCISRYCSQVHLHKFYKGVKAFQICRKSGRQNNALPSNYTSLNSNSLSPWMGRKGDGQLCVNSMTKSLQVPNSPRAFQASNAWRTNQQYLHFLWMEQVCIFRAVHEDFGSVPLLGGSS